MGRVESDVKTLLHRLWTNLSREKNDVKEIRCSRSREHQTISNPSLKSALNHEKSRASGHKSCDVSSNVCPFKKGNLIENYFPFFFYSKCSQQNLDSQKSVVCILPHYLILHARTLVNVTCVCLNRSTFTRVQRVLIYE